mmetsp:Transcript_21550/g.46379  ORF Transcript_21550/g.46379 Transcript_21550/m.46379 type:complete len:387 (-) Transcript_21550:38-1198(-)
MRARLFDATCCAVVLAAACASATPTPTYPQLPPSSQLIQVQHFDAAKLAAARLHSSAATASARGRLSVRVSLVNGCTLAVAVVMFTVLLQTISPLAGMPASLRSWLRSWSASRLRHEHAVSTISAFCMYAASDVLSQCIHTLLTGRALDASTAAISATISATLDGRTAPDAAPDAISPECVQQHQQRRRRRLMRRRSAHPPSCHRASNPLVQAALEADSWEGLRGGAAAPLGVRRALGHLGPSRARASLDLDLSRVLRSGATSALLSGYLAVFYFRLLDGALNPSAAAASLTGRFLPVIGKVLIDIGVYEPVYDVIYMSLQALLRGQSWCSLASELPKVLTVWAMAPRYWGIVSFVNFGFVALRLRPLYNSLFSIPWSMYLSSVAN